MQTNYLHVIFFLRIFKAWEKKKDGKLNQKT